MSASSISGSRQLLPEMQLPQPLSLSGDLRRLVTTAELQQIMASSPSMLSADAHCHRSRSARGSQAVLAQFGLSRSEVERWMQANGAPAPSPRTAVENLDVLSADSVSTQEGGGLACSDDSLKLHGSSGGGRSARHEWPVVYATYDGNIVPVPKQSEHESMHAIDRLQQFERRIHDVAQQAAALRSESHLLRNDALVDPRRLDALLSLLHLSTHGGHDGRQAATSAGAQQRPGAVRALAPQPIPSAVWQNRVPGLPLQRSDGPHERVVHACGSHPRPTGLPTPPHQPCDQPRHVKTLRRRNHRQDQLATLRRWFDEHSSDPYPTPEEKHDLAQQVGMEIKQIEHWFTNHRKRHWFRRGETPQNPAWSAPSAAPQRAPAHGYSRPHDNMLAMEDPLDGAPAMVEPEDVVMALT